MLVIDDFGEGFGVGLLTNVPSSQVVELVKGSPHASTIFAKPRLISSAKNYVERSRANWPLLRCVNSVL